MKNATKNAVVLIALTIVGVISWKLTSHFLEQKQTQQAQKTLAEQVQFGKNPQDANIKAVVFQAHSKTKENMKEDSWGGVIATQDGSSLTFVIDGVQSKGFTTVVGRCSTPGVCELRVDRDPIAIDSENALEVIENLVATARQIMIEYDLNKPPAT